MLLVESEVVTGEAGTKLVLTDLAAVVLVEVCKGRSKMILLQVIVAVKACCNKFGVVNEAVTIGVNDSHCI